MNGLRGIIDEPDRVEDYEKLEKRQVSQYR